MERRRRLHAVAHPFIERGQQGALYGRVVHRVIGQLPLQSVHHSDGLGRERTGAVHRAGEVVAARVLGFVGVAHLGEVCVDERRVAAPVLGGGVGEHNLRNASALLHSGDQRAGVAGYGIGKLGVGEREQFGDDVADVFGRLAEAQVELAAHPAGDVRHDAVERHASLLVVVHAVVDVGAEEASALGGAEGVGVVYRPGDRVAVVLGLVLEERYDVADGRHAESDDLAAGGGIDELIDAARLEAVAQIDVFDVRFDLLILDANELESVSRDLRGRLVGVITDGEGGSGFVCIGRRVRDVGAVCQQEYVGRLVALELVQDAPGERHAVCIEGLGGVHAHQVGIVRHVGLPATPDHGVAFAHQEAVSGFDGRAGIHGAGGAVEAENRLASAVHHVEDDAAASLVRVGGMKHLEVGGEADAALGVARGKFYVGNCLVVGVQRVNREVGGAL